MHCGVTRGTYRWWLHPPAVCVWILCGVLVGWAPACGCAGIHFVPACGGAGGCVLHTEGSLPLYLGEHLKAVANTEKDEVKVKNSGASWRLRVRLLGAILRSLSLHVR